MHPEHLRNLLIEESTGFLQLGGARMALLDIEAGFWSIRRQIEALIGPNLTNSVLQQAGANGGASFARSFAHPSEPDQSATFTACVQMYQLAGFGQFEITALEWPVGRILIQATQAFEAWMHQQHHEATELPICAYTAGVLVGFINVLNQRQDVVCIEHTCQAKGDETCSFELIPISQVQGQAAIPFSPDPGLGRQLNLLELLFERMPMGIAIFDRQLRLVRSNQTWAEFIDRYTPSSLSDVRTGARLSELAPGAEKFFDPLFQRVFAGETIHMDAFESISGGIVSYWDVVFSPLTEDGEIVGVLDVTTDATERVFLRQNLEQRVAERTQEAERRRQVAESMRDVIATINSSRSLGETLEFIVAQANRILGSQACLIHHIEDSQDFVSIQASAGLPPDLKMIPGFPLYSSSKADNRILNREPVWTADFRENPPLTEKQMASLHPDVRAWRELTGRYYRAWLAVPLVVTDQVYGSLAFYFAQPKEFDEEEIKLSQSFADQAALAIENAHLFEKAEEAAVTAERNRLARDLHDAVTQTLFSASMIAEVLPKIWERNPNEGLRRLEELRQLTRGALSEMRTLLVELRPAALVDTDLGDLIRHQVNAFIGRARLPVTYECNCVHNPLPDVKEAFYRITQEAFNNIAKHAEASAVTIQLDCQEDLIKLIIQDDGLGFDLADAQAQGFGLNIMTERAHGIGAQLEIDSQLRAGTTLRLTWHNPDKEQKYD